MLKRRIFASAALIFGQVKVWMAAAKAYCDALEARVSSQRIIVSDVFGADTFVSRTATTESSTRAARWDDGIQFEPTHSAAPMFNGGDDDLSAVPVFLASPRVPADVQVIDGRRSVRGTLPTLVCAVILLIAWITAGRSGPLARPAPSSADAIAEQFAGSDEDSVRSSAAIANADARLEFASRFAVFYADLLSKDGVCAGGDAIDTIQSAASVMIRDLPSGTVLSAGEQVSATSWRLKPDEVHAIVLKIPGDHSVPIQAKIETHDASGSVIGRMAVEIRETAKERVAGDTSQRKSLREATSKPSLAKRRSTASGLQQVAKKSGAAGDAATAQPANPAQQTLLTQFPFFPGVYDKNSPPGTTVGQQILINLGVLPASPTAAALTQSN